MTVELVTLLPLGFALAVLFLGLGYMLHGTIGDEMGSGFKGHRLDNRIQQLQARVLELGAAADTPGFSHVGAGTSAISDDRPSTLAPISDVRTRLAGVGIPK